MDYLKLYEQFQDGIKIISEPFRDNLKDILLEIEDEGFDVDIQSWNARHKKGPRYLINITKLHGVLHPSLFVLQDISECVLRICDYANSNNFNYRVLVSVKGTVIEITDEISKDFSEIKMWTQIRHRILFGDDERIYKVVIELTKSPQ